jgi:hypothetical protein
MPLGDRFYVVHWKNPALDEHDHFMILQVDPDDSVLRHIRLLKGHNPKLDIDEKQSLKAYGSKPEAQAEADRRDAEASAANPDRVPATHMFPRGQANRALYAGMPELNPTAPGAAPADE